MAQKKAALRPAINAFVKTLKEEIPVEEVILFGSWATGKPCSDSDIDLIVVSPAFAKGKYIENMQYLFRRAARVDSRIEPIPATREELLNLDERTLLAQAVSSGKVYYSEKP